MKKIVWDDAIHSVGHRHMDTHHKNLLRIINALVDLHDEIESITDITTAHKMKYLKKLVAIFSVEESLLQSIDYPDIEDQARDHIRYMDRIADFVVRPDITQLPEVTVFLGEWITNHILIEDMKYKPFVQ